MIKFSFCPKTCAMFWNICNVHEQFSDIYFIFSCNNVLILCFWDLDLCEPDSETLTSDTLRLTSWLVRFNSKVFWAWAVGPLNSNLEKHNLLQFQWFFLFVSDDSKKNRFPKKKKISKKFYIHYCIWLNTWLA